MRCHPPTHTPAVCASQDPAPHLCRLGCCNGPPVLPLDVELGHHLVHAAAKHLLQGNLWGEAPAQQDGQGIARAAAAERQVVLAAAAVCARVDAGNPPHCIMQS